jgi:hypothetical protein
VPIPGVEASRCAVKFNTCMIVEVIMVLTKFLSCCRINSITIFDIRYLVEIEGGVISECNTWNVVSLIHSSLAEFRNSATLKALSYSGTHPLR